MLREPCFCAVNYSLHLLGFCGQLPLLRHSAKQISKTSTKHIRSQNKARSVLRTAGISVSLSLKRKKVIGTNTCRQERTNDESLILAIIYFYNLFEICGAYTIGSGQKSLRLQSLQKEPIHTSSNCCIALSTRSGSVVSMPDSKLRVFSPFIPSPAPVRFAEPI